MTEMVCIKIVEEDKFSYFFTFNISIETCRKTLAFRPIIKDCDSDLIPGKDDIGPGSSLRHPVAAPLGLEPIVLPLNGNVGTNTVNGEGGGQVLEGHQEVQVPLRLEVRF